MTERKQVTVEPLHEVERVALEEAERVARSHVEACFGEHRVPLDDEGWWDRFEQQATPWTEIRAVLRAKPGDVVMLTTEPQLDPATIAAIRNRMLRTLNKLAYDELAKLRKQGADADQVEAVRQEYYRRTMAAYHLGEQS